MYQAIDIILMFIRKVQDSNVEFLKTPEAVFIHREASISSKPSNINIRPDHADIARDSCSFLPGELCWA